MASKLWDAMVQPGDKPSLSAEALGVLPLPVGTVSPVKLRRAGEVAFGRRAVGLLCQVANGAQGKADYGRKVDYRWEFLAGYHNHVSQSECGGLSRGVRGRLRMQSASLETWSSELRHVRAGMGLTPNLKSHVTTSG
jgi:hypothetical protein